MTVHGPTPYEDLNDVLVQLVKEVRALLKDNFVGAYLQGSFATGDFTESSDVDVLIAIRRDLTQTEVLAFQKLHKRLFRELSKPWGQRIELSYAPIGMLRRWSETPRDPPDLLRSSDWTDPSTNSPPRAYPFWYLDNGADHLVRSEHDNSRVVRWVAREKGVVLAGPDPRTLIDPVAPADLVLELRDMLSLVNEKWSTLDAIKTRGIQTFFVTLCCRALHTLETGTVTSKRKATKWAMTTLDRKWHALIERAWTVWEGSRHDLSEPADPLEIEQTIALMKYALEKAAQRAQDAV